MNNAKMWLVVKPTVGVPLFLSAVAIGSFAVHVAVLTNTNWVSNFLRGQPLNAARASLDGPKVATSGIVVKQGLAAEDVTVVMPDGRTGRVTFDAPRTVDTLALARPAPQ
jgi:light-harvesting protein B-800-850 alpha chain